MPPFLPDTPVCRAELAQYYQSVSRIDQGLGRLIEILKEAGKYDDTLIIFTSDHGIAFPGGKTTVYEGGMRVPLVVKLPGREQMTETGAGTSGESCDGQPCRSDADDCSTSPGPCRTDHKLHGRSWKDGDRAERMPPGWDEVNASHTFHEITMYYPMRVVRTSPVQADLEHRRPAAVSLSPATCGTRRPGKTAYRQRPGDALRQADGEGLHPPAGRSSCTTWQSRPDEIEEPGRRPELRETARRDEGPAQGFSEADERSVDSEMGLRVTAPKPRPAVAVPRPHHRPRIARL